MRPNLAGVRTSLLSCVAPCSVVGVSDAWARPLATRRAQIGQRVDLIGDEFQTILARVGQRSRTLDRREALDPLIEVVDGHIGQPRTARTQGAELGGAGSTLVLGKPD